MKETRVYMKLYGGIGTPKEALPNPLSINMGDLEKIVVRGKSTHRNTGNAIFGLPSDISPYPEEYMKIQRDGANLLITTPDPSLATSLDQERHMHSRTLRIGQKARYKLSTYRGKDPTLEIELKNTSLY